MSDKYLIKNLIEFSVTVHGLPDAEKFVEAFGQCEGELEVSEGNDNQEDSDIPEGK